MTCGHESILHLEDPYDSDVKCSDCGKLGVDIYRDVNDIDPRERISQQPHGKCIYYCNACGMYVNPVIFEGQESCPYHQRVMSDGSLLYDEFNQDGEEW